MRLFGIGLHSVFAVTDRISILTKTRGESLPHRIEMHSGKAEGFVFLREIEDKAVVERLRRGTEITLRIKPGEEHSLAGSSDPYEKQPDMPFLAWLLEYIGGNIRTPLFPVSFNGETVSEALYNSNEYSALFGKGLHQDENGVPYEKTLYRDQTGRFAIALTGEIPIEFAVWDRENALMYNIGRAQACIYIRGN